MGSTLPGPSAPGLVGGLWVIVSRGRPKMMWKCHEAQKYGRGFPTDTPCSYRVAPSQKHTGVERQVNITYIKSPYTRTQPLLCLDARVASPITAALLGQDQIIICYSRARPLLVKLIEVKRRCGSSLVVLWGCGSSLVL